MESSDPARTKVTPPNNTPRKGTCHFVGREHGLQHLHEDERTLSVADRLRLIQTLNVLPGPQFDELLFALNPPSANIPSHAAPQASRSKALFEWIESPIGPGLSELKAILESFIHT
ncbi:MAG: hypothetical protein AAF329_00345 [Cyanobacteria bacterium P01_A01_bin.17]